MRPEWKMKAAISRVAIAAAVPRTPLRRKTPLSPGSESATMIMAGTPVAAGEKDSHDLVVEEPRLFPNPAFLTAAGPTRNIKTCASGFKTAGSSVGCEDG